MLDDFFAFICATLTVLGLALVFAGIFDLSLAGGVLCAAMLIVGALIYAALKRIGRGVEEKQRVGMKKSDTGH